MEWNYYERHGDPEPDVSVEFSIIYQSPQFHCFCEDSHILHTTPFLSNCRDKDSPPVCTIPDTNIEEIGPYVDSLKAVSKSGVHNPLKNVERYLMYGEISRRVSYALLFIS